MWDRIYLTWKENMGGEYNVIRNNNSLACRWGKIQGVVNKFHGVYERLERNPLSETTLEDMKREALRMYEDIYKESFKFEHCWGIMIKNPKWCTKEITRANDTKKQKQHDVIKNQTPMKVNSSSNEDSVYVLGTNGVEDTNGNGIVRPQVRKACKEGKRRLNEERSVVDALNTLQSTLEKQTVVHREELELKREKEKREFELREQIMKKEIEIKESTQEMKRTTLNLIEKTHKREQHLIMNQDLSKLSPKLRETYE